MRQSGGMAAASERPIPSCDSKLLAGLPHGEAGLQQKPPLSLAFFTFWLLALMWMSSRCYALLLLLLLFLLWRAAAVAPARA